MCVFEKKFGGEYAFSDFVHILRGQIRIILIFFRNDGDATAVSLFFKLPVRPWDLSHCVERQKLMVVSREEMSVRVQKGGFVFNLLLG